MAALYPEMTTVDIAAASKDLTVKATVFAELGNPTPSAAEQAQMDVTIHQESARIITYLRRELAQEKVTDRFRPRWQYGCVKKLWLVRAPVVTIHAVVENGVTLAPTDYEVNAATSEFYRLDSSGVPQDWTDCDLITVQHTSGYVLLGNLPHDIEAACVAQCRASFQSRTRDPTIRSESVPGVHDVSFSVSGGDSFGKSGLLKSVEAALFPYRFLGLA